MSFDPAVWGTVSSWVGALLTGLSVLAAAVYYIFDRQRDQRTQASSVLCGYTPTSTDRPTSRSKTSRANRYSITNASSSPSPNARLRCLRARAGPTPVHSSGRPTTSSNTGRHSFLNYHDNSELYLADGQKVEHLPKLEYAPAVYDYYVPFEMYQQYWAVNARTQKLAGRLKRRELHLGRGGLDAT